MLKIYHTPPTRSVRVVWLAEEMGIPYEVVPVQFGGPHSPEFKSASPLGQLPAIEDGDVTMLESIAIMQYLLAKHGPSPLEVKRDEPDFPAYLQYLEFGEAGLIAIGNAYVATRLRAPEDEKKNWTVNYVIEAIRQRTGIVTARLQDHEYMAGGRFTAADISVGYALGIVKFFGLSELEPKSAAYLERLSSRPAYKKAAGQV